MRHGCLVILAKVPRLACFTAISSVGRSTVSRRDPRRHHLESELTLNQKRDDDREQRDSLDERREDDRASLNATCHLRLTCHAVHRLARQASDSDARADYRETSADARAEHAPRSRIRRVESTGLGYRLRCCLQQRKDRDHFLTPFDNRDMSCSRSSDRHPSAGLAKKSSQRTSPARSAGYLREGEQAPRQCAPSRINPMNTLDKSVKMNACRNATNSSRIEIPSAIRIGSGTSSQLPNVKIRLINASSTT